MKLHILGGVGSHDRRRSMRIEKLEELDLESVCDNLTDEELAELESISLTTQEDSRLGELTFSQQYENSAPRFYYRAYIVTDGEGWALFSQARDWSLTGYDLLLEGKLDFWLQRELGQRLIQIEIKKLEN